MKKSFLTLAAIALVLSFTSCKEDSAEKTEVEVIETETPAEVMETPTEEVVDTISDEASQVEENTTETSVN
ncbi:hypothetical protein SAMN04487764_3025 [Gillisia sp. Hel1_33_143]|uniref:hypothetical protein n=1 Tax=unclassified Gillisia TaxID=2615025 RepID=UPI000550F220|nr:MULTISPECIES: hypothetical protein [unclassified Gillisia]SDS77417.1 hypothetical protein SAMN04487764_3025 [Gillisia sp. Hel1_33_143]